MATTTHLARKAFELWCGLDATELPEGEQWTEERHEMDCTACYEAEQRNYALRALDDWRAARGVEY